MNDNLPISIECVDAYNSLESDDKSRCIFRRIIMVVDELFSYGTPDSVIASVIKNGLFALSDYDVTVTKRKRHAQDDRGDWRVFQINKIVVTDGAGKILKTSAACFKNKNKAEVIATIRLVRESYLLDDQEKNLLNEKPEPTLFDC